MVSGYQLCEPFLDESAQIDECRSSMNEWFMIGELAQDLLGLTGEKADVLFHSCNTLPDLHRISDQLAREVDHA